MKPSFRTWLFTGEPYSKMRQVTEQLTDQVTYAMTRDDAAWVLGISANFVTESIEGTFKDTAILMMACDCLHFEDTGQAFIEKGASTYRWRHRSYKVAESSEINIG